MKKQGYLLNRDYNIQINNQNKMICEKYKYQQKDLVGVGVYSKVYKAISIDTNQYVALKKYKSDFCQFYFKNAEIKQIMQREVNILKLLQHQNIIKFIDFLQFKQKSQLYLVAEYCNQGTLEAMKNEEKISQYQVFKIFTQIVDAMVYVHKKNIFHRDLKPQNIYIHNNVVKIGDFGLSREVKINNTQTDQPIVMSKQRGTAYYMAPNVFNSPYYTNKCDIWSFGVMMYEILTGRKLFKHNQAELFDAHHKLKNQNFILEQKCHPFFRILEKIIVYEQKERLNFQEIQICIKQQIQNVEQQLKCKQKELKRLLFLYNRTSLYEIPDDLFYKNDKFKLKIGDQYQLGIRFLCTSIAILELEQLKLQINHYAQKYKKQIKHGQLKKLVEKVDKELKKVKSHKRVVSKKIMYQQNLVYNEGLQQYITTYYDENDYKVQTFQFYNQELVELIKIIQKNISQKFNNDDKELFEQLSQIQKIKQIFEFQAYQNPNFSAQFHDLELKFIIRYQFIFKRK